ncbi:MAG: DUF86 domain-containing protein [Proteobacteria bacterium]|nr:DUF86 domain-containing protein [Pseudomonadota bacterium]
MNRNITLYLQDILDNMERAEEFVETMDYEAFSRDTKTSYAVVRCIEIIGEATKNIPMSIRRKYPQMPWKEMAGMRDKVIHFYFGVNPQKVWLVVKEDIPTIKPILERIKKDLQKKEK